MTTKVLRHQLEFITSDFRHTGLVGGFRSGKSQAGVMKTVAKKESMPGIDVAYYLPTYGLIKDVAFPKFTDYLTENNRKFTLNKTDKDIITPHGRIIFRSMDAPESIIGYEVGYSLVDEIDTINLNKANELMKAILARNSVKSPWTNNATDFVSTPEGFNFLYDFFIKKHSSNKKLIKASTRNNPFISHDYIRSLEESYTPQQLDAYLEGNFVNLSSGSVFHTFDREKNHSFREIQKNDVLHIGLDFNITNMSAVIHVTDADVVTAVAEIEKVYDTENMILVIKERFKDHKIIVYPDASGNARNTAGDSDILLLRKAGLMVQVGKSNPAVRDRITTANVGFGSEKYMVNTYKCPAFTESLEKLAYKNGLPDKQSGFDHITDGGTYAYYSLKKNKITYGKRSVRPRDISTFGR